MRNRAAAQSSRERKRKEVQALEEEKTRLAESNADMRARLVAQEEANRALRRKLERYEQYMRVTSDIAMKATVNPTTYFPVPEPTVKEEESPFLFFGTSEAAPVTTLDPVNLHSGLTNPSSETSENGESSMAHQSAELMCGLQCLRENPSPEAWWESLLSWIGLVLFLTLNTSTHRSYSKLMARVEGAQRILHQMSIQQPSLLKLSSISIKLRTQLQQRIQTSSQALARLIVAATGLDMRSESAVESAFFDIFQASSGESERSLMGGNIDEDSLVENEILKSAQSYLRDIKLSRIAHLV